MKWLKLVGISLMFFTMLALGEGNVAYAAESYPRESFFEKFSDSDKMVELPNGGFLHGKAVVYESVDSDKIVKEYDSATDSSAKTVGEIKNQLQNESIKSNLTLNLNAENQPKGAGVPTQVVGIPYGGEYVSEAFSSSGWRFGGYLFKAITSPLPNLIWSSHVDSGIVGTQAQADYTHSHGSQSVYQGTVVGVGSRVSLGGTRCFYTYSPINGTYYYVGNVDARK